MTELYLNFNNFNLPKMVNSQIKYRDLNTFYIQIKTMSDVLSAALRCLTLSGDEDSLGISYLQQLAESKLYFKVKWGVIAIKNCDQYGRLLEFKSKGGCTGNLASMWHIVGDNHFLT